MTTLQIGKLYTPSQLRQAMPSGYFISGDCLTIIDFELHAGHLHHVVHPVLYLGKTEDGGYRFLTNVVLASPGVVGLQDIPNLIQFFNSFHRRPERLADSFDSPSEAKVITAYDPRLIVRIITAQLTDTA